MMWFLVGPTAVGKSEIAIELALRLDAEIVTADSMQVYRGMDIGTAKPSARDQSRVRHHLLDVADVSERYDVARYRKAVLELLPRIEARGKKALIVGGSGMYVRALSRGLFEGGRRDPEVRARWLKIGENKGMTYLHHILERVDPAAASRISPQDTRRVVRALEHFEITGRPISREQTQWKNGGGGREVMVGLDRPRKALYARCDRRVETMIGQGLLDEVRRLRDRLESSPTAGQAVGYKEALAHLRGELSAAEMADEIRKHTRQLAKRQLTWFRREHNLKWLILEDGQTTSQIASLLEPYYRSS